MIIYKITNKINGKIYIGKNKNDRDNYYGSGRLIKRTIKKYGINNFVRENIDFTTLISELNEKEQFWIDYYNSTNLLIGYNISKGGDGGDNFTNNPNKEIIRKRYCERTGNKNGMFGRHHTPDALEKMCLKKKGQGKGRSPWNKGVSTRNYSEAYQKHYSLSGRNHWCAKIFTFISPNNEIFKVKGEYGNFCTENQLDIYSSRHFINKGVIPPPQKGKPKQKRLNLVGWQIIR